MSSQKMNSKMSTENANQKEQLCVYIDRENIITKQSVINCSQNQFFLKAIHQ